MDYCDYLKEAADADTAWSQFSEEEIVEADLNVYISLISILDEQILGVRPHEIPPYD